MHKTILITLNKIIFSIEEDAYDLLKQYLDSIKDYFSSAGGSEEILMDMESSLAEKLSAKGFSREKAITKADVEALVKIMGTVKDIKGETEAEQDDFNSGDRQKKEKTKHLYRNPDDVIIAGVCSGLATYFGIDPIFVRLVFVLTVFFGGTGVVAYLILWLVMPEAKTNVQKLEMQGTPVTLKKLEQTVREKIADVATPKNAGTLKRILAAPFKLLGKIMNAVKIVLKKISPLFIRFIGVMIAIAMIAVIFCLTWAAGVLMFNLDSPYIVSDLPVREIIQIMPYSLFIVALYCLTVIPIIFLLLAGLTLAKLKNSFKASVAFAFLGIWLLAIIVSSVIAIDTFPQIPELMAQQKKLQAAEAVSKDYDFKDFNRIEAGGSYELIVKQGREYKITVTGGQNDLNNMLVRKSDNTLIISKNPAHVLCFFCSPKPVQVNITLPELAELSLSEAASLNIDDFKAEAVEINLLGASRANLDLTVKTANLYLSGASKLSLAGSAQKLSLISKGAAKLTADKFPVDSAELELSGASKAEVNVKNNLKVKAFGASRVYYAGLPKIESELAGSSELLPVNK